MPHFSFLPQKKNRGKRKHRAGSMKNKNASKKGKRACKCPGPVTDPETGKIRFDQDLSCKCAAAQYSASQSAKYFDKHEVGFDAAPNGAKASFDGYLERKRVAIEKALTYDELLWDEHKAKSLQNHGIRVIQQFKARLCLSDDSE